MMEAAQKLRFVLETSGRSGWTGGKIPDEYATIVEKHNRKALEDDESDLVYHVTCSRDRAGGEPGGEIDQSQMIASDSARLHHQKRGHFRGLVTLESEPQSREQVVDPGHRHRRHRNRDFFVDTRGRPDQHELPG